MHVDDMSEHDAFHLGLHRPVHDCPDLAPYVPELARAGAKLRAAKMATMPHITACKNDVLMELDAACAFLVETCFTADAELLFLVKELRLDAWTARIVFLLSLARCGVAARFRSLAFVCGEAACVTRACACRSRLLMATSLLGGRWFPRSCGWRGQRSCAAQGTQSGGCGSRATGYYACSEKNTRFAITHHHAAVPRAIRQGYFYQICIYVHTMMWMQSPNPHNLRKELAFFRTPCALDNKARSLASKSYNQISPVS